MNPQIAILMGSDSDRPVMDETGKILEQFGVAYDMKVLSAHRSPKLVTEYAAEAQERGIKVFICGAGGAAHLAGVVAAHTILPVIGVPLESALKGVDSFVSTLQMPAGVPVATVAIGKAGAKNAAYLALEILALGDRKLIEKLYQHKREMEKGVREKNQ